MRSFTSVVAARTRGVPQHLPLDFSVLARQFSQYDSPIESSACAVAMARVCDRNGRARLPRRLRSGHFDRLGHSAAWVTLTDWATRLPGSLDRLGHWTNRRIGDCGKTAEVAPVS
jgi:transposase